MIILDESIKSEAQLKLAEKLERDRKKLQDQIKKDHKQILEKKRKSKNLIGDLFAEHLPDFYNFEAEELKDIIDTAMTQKATEKKIVAIKKAVDNISDLYRSYHILQNDRLMINSSVIEPEDYTVFAENERILL